MSNEAGLFLIGVGVGMFVSTLPMPAQLSSIQPYFGLIMILIGVILMLKTGKSGY
jgi:hypothetical protein